MKSNDRGLRLLFLLFFCFLWDTTTSFASIQRYDYPSQHSALVEQAAPITHTISELSPVEQQPSFLAPVDPLASTEPSQSHIYANASPSLGKQTETTPPALQPAVVTASFIGQNGQLIAAEGAPKFIDAAKYAQDAKS